MIDVEGMDPMLVRAALYQGPARAQTVPDALRAIADAAERAAAAGASILITPEMSATGYDIGELVIERAEPSDGPLCRVVAETAAATGVSIVFGFPERAGGTIHNAVQVIAPDGTVLAHYRKTHLFGDLDRAVFTPGDELVVQFDHGGIRCGIAICYDVEFPEVVRAHADRGTQWLIVPTGLMAPYDVVAERVVPARAYESQLIISYVNRCGRERTLEYTGLSCTAGPDGVDLVRAGREEDLLLVTIDAADLARSRRENTHLTDRRHDLYPPPSQEHPS